MDPEQWNEAADAELRRRLEAFESLDSIAARMSRPGALVTHDDLVMRAAELELGKAARRRSRAWRKRIADCGRPIAAEELAASKRELEVQASVEAAQRGFVAAMRAGAMVADLAAQVRARALRGREGDLGGAQRVEAWRIVLGVAVLHYGFKVKQVAAVCGMHPAWVKFAVAEMGVRLAAAMVAPRYAPLGAVLDVVLEVLEQIPPSKPRPPAARAIVYAVARETGVTVAELEARSRRKRVVRVRHLAIALARLLTTRSLPEIGRVLGGRDHTTVLHAVRRMDALGLKGFEPREGATLGEIVRDAMARIRMT